jgi:hypothetical protein
MEKACYQCGKTFESQRSDAQYCSEKCRAKANYEKKRKKEEGSFSFESLTGTANPENARIVLGDMDYKELKATLSKIEKDLDARNEQMAQLEHENRQLQNDILLLNQQILSIRDGKLTAIMKQLELPDFYIYNNFLNEDYLKAKSKGDPYARNHLKSAEDLQRIGNNELRLKIGNYRYKLTLTAESIETKIKAIATEIATKKNTLNNNSEKIKGLLADTRFYQSRVLKYDSLLSV